ncbi:MAG: tetratricopeptide repeat protein [Candidatus Obscuribacterales bacterium]|nr:tetratricopeptide repeat protein [Candidatus Obscuribacterales bacterium]
MAKFAPVLLTLMLSLAVSSSASEAATKSEFEQAVAIYLEDNYLEALNKFQALAKKEPNNPRVQYYLALSYQRLGKHAEAAAAYQSALKNSKDQAFNEVLNERLARVLKRLGKSTGKKLADEESVQVAAKHEPLSRVIWFSTNWCSVCKHFEPSWENAKKKFKGKILFEHLNAEDPSAFKEVQTYRPKAYPTLVYIDAKNQVISNHAEAPSPSDFVKTLESYGAKQ